MAAKDFFAKYATTEHKAKLECMDGAEITYRKLTRGESDDFTKRMFKDIKGSNEPQMDFDQALKIKYEKVALALISPEVTVKDLRAMSSDVSEFLTEVTELIEPTPKGDDEGND